ncbi:MAG: DUF1152 domain-containing protein, partial [Desulfurococcales archaeon]|nr:DUF1152 domain-containing protein [Desulfurococcales archaeon]
LGAIHLYLKLRRLDAEPILGSIVWERLPVDPNPGPAPIENLVGGRRLGSTSALVSGGEVVVRGGVSFKPQVVRAAEVLGSEALYIDASKGPQGIAEALRDAAVELGVDVVVALDSGGDALAAGCEESLWSPLADAMSLNALLKFPGERLLAVHGLGTDGELPRSYLLARLSELASRGGVIEIAGMSRGEAAMLRKVLDRFESEASKAPVEAFLGALGARCIRRGTRRIELDLLQAATIIVDPDRLAEMTEMPGIVEGARSVEEASKMMNSKCIYTELDLEKDLAYGRATSPEEARRRGRERLLASGCKPLKCPQYYSNHDYV